MPPTTPAARRPGRPRSTPARPDDTLRPRPPARADSTAAPASAAERAGPASSRAADFGIDTTTKTTSEAIRAYVQNLRNGELGALPALLGLLALFVLFTVLDSGGTFPSLLNLANLLQQGAGQTVIAMGLVFVLLIGEIDLAAGTASGLAAGGARAAPGQRRQPARRDGHHGVRRVRRDHGAGGRTRGAGCGSGPVRLRRARAGPAPRRLPAERLARDAARRLRRVW